MINRTGNSLTWNIDSKNLAKKIAIHYRTYGEEGNTMFSGSLLVDDNGSYNIDSFIKDNKVKKLYFSLIRGNGFSAQIDGKKTGFAILSVDHHNYTIK